ncbi:MAG: hypothetical protein CMH33_05230 [Microbacterium sp.]|uniref:DUF2332 domain-containing protein n=1 Tax=Microbacterium sp. UBA3394 TaxID=1946945 RepID=UPI000C5595F8|nr:DUF2332 domain-containing protein [Microbacterium sp. UBA3394]MAB20301.1 hypothetical protein [Microbacterium sp.]MAM54914.1 hypothetical protein [Microbacterium sp.]|tara:strand:- start:8474 stop:9460 length:987 start_codon:yes stop_codon:yes gene_type:complete
MSQVLADGYRRFAELEAAGVSAIYFDWATGVADDPAVLDLIAALPATKKQPNLVFAAARFLGAPAGRYADFRDWIIEHWDAVIPVIMARSTQTNEAARCAVLLPVLEQLEGPLALIEAGAAGGLVLYPDRYSYRYTTDGTTDHVRLDPSTGPSPVELPCTIDAASVPSRLPDVAWRAGVDLNPLDVADPDQLAWLETLVWPEHAERRDRLHRAAALVAADPPHLVAGDIIDEIPALIEQAPAGSHVVVFHSAVLVYLAEERRTEFARLMQSMNEVTWISNEGAGVLPFIMKQVDDEVRGRTILARDGEPVALVGPHGQSFQRLQSHDL